MRLLRWRLLRLRFLGLGFVAACAFWTTPASPCSIIADAGPPTYVWPTQDAVVAPDFRAVLRYGGNYWPSSSLWLVQPDQSLLAGSAVSIRGDTRERSGYAITYWQVYTPAHPVPAGSPYRIGDGPTFAVAGDAGTPSAAPSPPATPQLTSLVHQPDCASGCSSCGCGQPFACEANQRVTVTVDGSAGPGHLWAVYRATAGDGAFTFDTEAAAASDQPSVQLVEPMVAARRCYAVQRLGPAGPPSALSPVACLELPAALPLSCGCPGDGGPDAGLPDAGLPDAGSGDGGTRADGGRGTPPSSGGCASATGSMRADLVLLLPLLLLALTALAAAARKRRRDA